MSAPGTVSSTSSGCAPSYPSIGWNGSYLCVANPTVGSSFDLSTGDTFCIYAGLAARKVGGYWTCQDPASVLPGDVVSVQGNPSAATAAALCAARGLGTESTTGISPAGVQCKAADSVALPVSDSSAGAKLDTLHGDLTTLNATTAGSSSSTGVVSLDVSQYGPMLSTVLVGLCFVLVLLAALTARTLTRRG